MARVKEETEVSILLNERIQTYPYLHLNGYKVAERYYDRCKKAEYKKAYILDDALLYVLNV